jgi:hypothetical protein
MKKDIIDLPGNGPPMERHLRCRRIYAQQEVDNDTEVGEAC